MKGTSLSGINYHYPGVVGYSIYGTSISSSISLPATIGNLTKYKGHNNITMFFNILDGYPATTEGVMGIFDKSNFDVYIQSSQIHLYTSKGGTAQQASESWSEANVYHMITGRYCYNQNISIWNNDAQGQVVSAAGPFDDWASSNSLHFNAAMTGSGYTGGMDEFRLSYRALSDAYIKMTYGEQYNYAGFLYLGAEETYFKSNGQVTLSNPQPADNATGIPVWQATWKVNVSVNTGNSSNVRIRCTKLGIDTNSTGYNRTITVSIPSRLKYSSTYVWIVNATSGNSVNKTYKFTTRANIVPTVSSQSPVNKSKGTLPGSINLHYTITDKLGDKMNWTVQLSNGAHWSANASSNSTWQKPTTVLPTTNYTWWVNVSDQNSTARYRMWFVTGLAISVVMSNIQPANLSTNDDVWSSISLMVNKTGIPPTPPIRVRVICTALAINQTTWGQNRTVTVALPRLAYSTTYVWTAKAVVNGTSKRYWDNESYSFTTRANVVPTISNPYFANGTSNVNLYTNQILHADINDLLGDSLTWSIQCNNGASASGTSYNATVNCPLGSLKSAHSYNWWVNVSDANSSVHYKYSFTTRTAGVTLSTEQPTNGSTGINVWLSSLSIATASSYGNTTTVWIHCTQINLNANSTGVNRTCTASIAQRLHYSTTYHWTVVAYADLYRTRYWTNESYDYFTTRSNLIPTISNPYFANNTVSANIYPNQQVHTDIADALGDQLTWTIHVSNGASNNGVGYNATVSCNLGTLKSATSYNWWVNVSDVNSSIHYKYLFTTKASGITFSSETPTNGSTGINVWQSSTGIFVGTTYNNQTTVEVKCAQLSIDSTTTGANRTVTTSIPSRLHYSTTYRWTVSAYSDIYRTRYWKNESYLFTTRANIAPAISSISPANHSQGVAITANVSAYISDALGDQLTWTLEVNNTVWSGTRYNGTIARTITLQSSHNYSWWVNVSDANTTSKTKAWFITLDPDKPTILAKMNYSSFSYGIFLSANQSAKLDLYNISDTNPVYYDITINVTDSAGDHFNFMTHNPTALWEHAINLSNGNNIIWAKATDHFGNVKWYNLSFSINIYKFELVEEETGRPLQIGRFHYPDPWSILNVSLPELYGTEPPNHNTTGYTWDWNFLVHGAGWEYPSAWPGRGGGALRYGFSNNENFTVVYPNVSNKFPPINSLHPYSLRFNIQFWKSGSDPAGTLITSYFDPTLIKDYDSSWTPNATIRITIPSLGYGTWGTGWPLTGQTWPQGPFYEQDITSTETKPFGVFAMNSQAWNLLDYTKFVAGTTTSYEQYVYTIPGLYYFKIYKGGTPIVLTTIDGGKASTIDLDLLQASTYQMPAIPGVLGVQKLSNFSLLIYYYNPDRSVAKTQLLIYNASHQFLSYNETNNPNQFYVYFDWATTTPPVNTNDSLTIEVLPQGQPPVSTTIIVNGMIGTAGPGGAALPPEMVLIICIGLLLFGLTLFSVGTTVAFVGPVMCGISLAFTALATQTWYIHLLQFMMIFFIIFMIVIFRYEYSTDRGVQ